MNEVGMNVWGGFFAPMGGKLGSITLSPGQLRELLHLPPVARILFVGSVQDGQGNLQHIKVVVDHEDLRELAASEEIPLVKPIHKVPFVGWEEQ